MAWTAPMTFAPNSVLTAAQMNTHVRDNLLELAPAKASQTGSLFMGDGPNRIAQRIPKSFRVDTSESVKNTEYRNLRTAGPKVTVTTGTKALVFIASFISCAAADQAGFMSYEISGATYREPSDTTALVNEGIHAGKGQRWCQCYLEDDLKPGVNTFTAKYKSSKEDSNATFFYRFISVVPL